MEANLRRLRVGVAREFTSGHFLSAFANVAAAATLEEVREGSGTGGPHPPQGEPAVVPDMHRAASSAAGYIPFSLTPLAYDASIYPCLIRHWLTVQVVRRRIDTLSPHTICLRCRYIPFSLTPLAYDAIIYPCLIRHWLTVQVVRRRVDTLFPHTICLRCRYIPFSLTPLAYDAGIYPFPSHHWLTMQVYTRPAPRGELPRGTTHDGGGGGEGVVGGVRGGAISSQS